MSEDDRELLHGAIVEIGLGAIELGNEGAGVLIGLVAAAIREEKEWMMVAAITGSGIVSGSTDRQLRRVLKIDEKMNN